MLEGGGRRLRVLQLALLASGPLPLLVPLLCAVVLTQILMAAASRRQQRLQPNPEDLCDHQGTEGTVYPLRDHLNT